MSSYTDTQPRPTSSFRGGRPYGLRHAGARAFALGAVIAGLSVGGAWLASADSTSTPRRAGANSPTSVSGAALPSGGAGGSATVEHGASIAALQRELAQLNYYEGPIDGALGPQTIEAIKDFQRANGLAVDGLAGPATAAKISQQLKTGDSQMSGSGLPAKKAPTQSTTPTKAQEASSGTGGTSAGSAASGSASAGGSSGPADPASRSAGASVAQ